MGKRVFTATGGARHPERGRGWRSRARAGAVALLVVGAAGCGGGDGGATTSAQGSGAARSSCPESVEPLVSLDTAPTAELSVAVDGSDSFWRGPGASERIHEQLNAVVAQAVDSGSALRVVVFTHAATYAQTVFACPVLAPRYNNEAARDRRREHLERQVQEAVWQGVTAPRPPAPRGTSVVGGFLALADAPALVPDSTPRSAVMLTDGGDLPREDTAVDLSGFASVAMYGVGVAAQQPLTTDEAAQLAAQWTEWLKRAGVAQPVVSSQSLV